jgi:hypothetical protein
MVEVDHKDVTVLYRAVPVGMGMGFGPLPSLVVVMVMFVMHMQMFVPRGRMNMVHRHGIA